MRVLHLVVLLGVLAGACATPADTRRSTTSVNTWAGRDIADLIGVIGPFDTTTARGDARTYDWFRFSNCRLSAHTSPDNKILKVELEGTNQGCGTYLQKLGAT